MGDPPSNEYLRDPSPDFETGELRGEGILELSTGENSPFKPWLDVKLLVKEVQDGLDAVVTEISAVSSGSNYWGFHMRVSNGQRILARIARSDVNMPNYRGWSFENWQSDSKFEGAVYEALRGQPSIRASHLLSFRAPQKAIVSSQFPQNNAGRALFVFIDSQGVNGRVAGFWSGFGPQQKLSLLEDAAIVRGTIFTHRLDHPFAKRWLRERLFEHRPASIPVDVAPTKEFCLALLTSKVEATIGEIGEMIGWPSDEVTVGPVAAAAKQSLLKYIPHMVPKTGNHDALYRLVLEHGDYGIHNMSMTVHSDSDKVCIESLYDWESARIVPAILSDPLMAVSVDLEFDELRGPSYTRAWDDATDEDRRDFRSWSDRYFGVLFKQYPEYEEAIRAGADARHLWFALRDWRGEVPEEYFGALGTWAEEKMRALGEHTS